MQARQTSIFPASSREVWEKLLRSDTLFFVTEKWVTFEDTKSFPKKWEAGTTVKTRIRPFGLGRGSEYEIYVEQVDVRNKTIQTCEHGAGIEFWTHTMQVMHINEKACIYIDTVDVRAGLITPLLWLYVKAYYRHRHRRWKDLLH